MAEPTELIAIGAKQLKKISSTPSLDSEVLLAYTLNTSRAGIYTAEITNAHTKSFLRLINKRKTGMPLAYITGIAWFYGLPILVNKSVLIPRPETEWLVARALEIVRTNKKIKTIVDLGTGSGCIALALAYYLPDHTIIGIDKSANALKLAKQNAKQLKINNIKWKNNNLLNKFNKPIDLLVANLPYLNHKEYKKPLSFEPKLALVGDTQLYQQLFEKPIFKIGLLEMKPQQINKVGKLAIKQDYQTGSLTTFGVGFLEVVRQS